MVICNIIFGRERCLNISSVGCDCHFFPNWKITKMKLILKLEDLRYCFIMDYVACRKQLSTFLDVSWEKVGLGVIF